MALIVRDFYHRWLLGFLLKVGIFMEFYTIFLIPFINTFRSRVPNFIPKYSFFIDLCHLSVTSFCSYHLVNSLLTLPRDLVLFSFYNFGLLILRLSLGHVHIDNILIIMLLLSYPRAQMDKWSSTYGLFKLEMHYLFQLCHVHICAMIGVSENPIMIKPMPKWIFLYNHFEWVSLMSATAQRKFFGS